MVSLKWLACIAILISSVSADAQDDLYHFREAAPATLGIIFLVAALAVTLWAIRSQSGWSFRACGCCSNPVTGTINSILGVLVFLSIFMMCGYQWLLGYQAGFFSLVGLYCLAANTKPFLVLYGILSLFNTFCLLGAINFMGYVESAMHPNPTECLKYFGPDVSSDRCDGYLGLLRVVGIFSIFCQALASFLWYVHCFSQGDRVVVAPAGYSAVDSQPHHVTVTDPSQAPGMSVPQQTAPIPPVSSYGSYQNL